MKYIRTKDDIYELMPNLKQDQKVSFDGEILEPAYYTINHEWIAKRDVIKQADTIEELCDEFVLIRNGTIRVYPKKHLLEESIIGYCMGDEVYGAIWTNKGLIFVAKMNDKGELELL